jgi:hypothetical protein
MFQRAMACFAVLMAAAQVAALDTAKIERLTGLKGALSEKEGVFKVSYPRADLEVKVGGVKISPALGLTAWAAFTEGGGHTMVMGDMVLAEDQVNPVMSVALDNGLEVTALHNHFLWDSPRVMFMHVGGMGGEEKLAAAIGKVFEALKATAGGKGSMPAGDVNTSSSTLDAVKLDGILGTKGEVKGGVYKAVWGKTTKMSGHEMGKAMGVNTWAAFAGSDGKAMVDGDFAMYESELQVVLKALRGAGINIVAIHNHMTEESPRVIFLHYWGVGPAPELAKALKGALDAQGKK